MKTEQQGDIRDSRQADHASATPDGGWASEYARILEQAGRRGGMAHPGAGAERRRHPRFRLRSGHIGVQIETQLPVLDLSLSGVAVRSGFALDRGDTLSLVLAGAFRVEVEVVACAPSQDDAQATRYPWRIHSRFLNPADGLRLLVMLYAMDDLELAAPAAGVAATG